MNPSTRCRCTHDASIHTPTGRMDDTDERGHGPCTAGVWGRPCSCERFVKAEAA